MNAFCWRLFKGIVYENAFHVQPKKSEKKNKVFLFFCLFFFLGGGRPQIDFEYDYAICKVYLQYVIVT